VKNPDVKPQTKNRPEKINTSPFFENNQQKPEKIGKKGKKSTSQF
jgi:hypothetical protein